jgi:glycine/D-amino acid oxidase-like deaminating enzyme
MPIYEASASAPGAFVATSHSGVTLAAVHALELAPQLAAGTLDPALTAFSGQRLRVAA